MDKTSQRYWRAPGSLVAVVMLLIGILSAGALHAQSSFGVVTLLAGGTNNVAAATTNTYTITLDCRKLTEVGLTLQFKGRSTNASDIVFTFYRSADGTNYSTVNPHLVTLTADTTNTVTCVTNLTVGNIGWLKLTSIGNPSEGDQLTNVLVCYSVKRL